METPTMTKVKPRTDCSLQQPPRQYLLSGNLRRLPYPNPAPDSNHSSAKIPHQAATRPHRRRLPSRIRFSPSEGSTISTTIIISNKPLTNWRHLLSKLPRKSREGKAAYRLTHRRHRRWRLRQRNKNTKQRPHEGRRREREANPQAITMKGRAMETFPDAS